MKIKLKIYISSLSILLLITIMLGGIYNLSTKVKEELSYDKTADALLRQTSDLIILINEYLITGYERSEIQWALKYNEVIDSLDMLENNIHISSMKEEFKLLKNNYERLKIENIYHKTHSNLPLSSVEVEKSNNLIEMLSSQLLLNSQNILSLTFRISSDADKNIRAYNSLMITMIVGFSIITILIIAFTSFLTISRVSAPLTNLVSAVKNMRKGDLSFEYDLFSRGGKKDELDELGEGFDKMTIALSRAFGELDFELSEKKKAVLEMEQFRNYLNNIIDEMPSALIGIDRDFNVTLWNNKAEETTGLRAKDVFGTNLSHLLPAIESEAKEVYSGIEARHRRYEYKKRIGNRTENIIEDVTIYPLDTNGVKSAVIRIDDVTEKVKINEMIVQSEKMLTVGGLAAGMAHEIKNPLAGMVQNASVLENRLIRKIDMPANLTVAAELGISMDDIKQFMLNRSIPRICTAIMESGERISSIIDNMLSFSRKGDMSFQINDPVTLIDKTLELASSDLNIKKNHDFKNIQIIKEYEQNLPGVPCDLSKIQQVVLNILRNGAEAMYEYNDERAAAGVEIETSHFIISARKEVDENMIRFEIEDNGPGMSDEIRRKIFEPFFTTKPAGIGTGLGLSVSYFIITENHGGTMAVESESGVGTTFIIRLPL